MPEWFEPIRMTALLLIHVMFALQVWSIHIIYRQFKRWADDEAARRRMWAEDMATIERMRQEAEHLRHQTEIALALARRGTPAA